MLATNTYQMNLGYYLGSTSIDTNTTLCIPCTLISASKSNRFLGKRDDGAELRFFAMIPKWFLGSQLMECLFLIKKQSHQSH